MIIENIAERMTRLEIVEKRLAALTTQMHDANGQIDSLLRWQDAGMLTLEALARQNKALTDKVIQLMGQSDA